MKLKLTNRERILLTVAGICLVVAILFYAVIQPQLDMVSRLERQAMGYRATIDEIKGKASLENPVYKDYKTINEKTQNLLKRFYPSIIQEKIILLLDDKIKKAGVNVQSISFLEPAPSELQQNNAEIPSKENDLKALIEQLEPSLKAGVSKQANISTKQENPITLERMTVTINFKGSYNQIFNFIKLIEQEKRSIVCSNLSISKNNGGLLTGVIELDFYSIPKPFIQDEEYLNWGITGQYGNVNPFGSTQGVTDTFEAAP